MNSLLTYANNEQGQLVHVDSVPNGNACKCTCPKCHKPLDAKNGGSIREHHFAHAHGNVCEGAVETALHLLAKEILLEEKAILLPKCDKWNFPQSFIRLHDVKQETWDNLYNIKPDAEGIMENGERILIEFYVSHKITDNKRKIIVNNNIKCIEIDLNYVPLDKNAIRTFLLSDTNNKKWITTIEETNLEEGLFSSGQKERNEWQLKAIDYLKEQFDNKSLSIGFDDEVFNLGDKGYDVCDTKSELYHGFKYDCLLSRSNEKGKGYIAISVRGRRRNEGHQIPNGLRVIDIIIRDKNGFDLLREQKVLSHDGMQIIFEGFKKESSKRLKQSIETNINYQTSYDEIGLKKFNENLGKGYSLSKRFNNEWSSFASNNYDNW